MGRIMNGELVSTHPAQWFNAQTLQEPDPNQRNTLMLVVDQLDQPKPVLEGVWLLIISELTNEIQLFPMDIQSTGGDWATTESLDKKFSLGRDHLPAKSFIDALHSRDVRWDNIAIIDRAGLAGLAGLLGWINPGKGNVSLDPGKFSKQKPTFTIQKNLISQVVYLRGLCERNLEIIQKMDPETVITLLEDHLKTDFDLRDLDEFWNRSRDQERQWFCEFPTLGKDWLMGSSQ
jgi:hypothetical protein